MVYLALRSGIPVREWVNESIEVIATAVELYQQEDDAFEAAKKGRG